MTVLLATLLFLTLTLTIAFFVRKFRRVHHRIPHTQANLTNPVIYGEINRVHPKAFTLYLEKLDPRSSEE